MIPVPINLDCVPLTVSLGVKTSSLPEKINPITAAIKMAPATYTASLTCEGCFTKSITL